MPPDPCPMLVIGLGGTGQAVAGRVQHELLALYGVGQPATLPPQVQVLGLDTDYTLPSGELRAGTPPLAQAQRLVLGVHLSAWLQEIARRPQDYPHITRWCDVRAWLRLPTLPQWANLVNGADGQRPLARLALFYNLAHSRSLALGLQQALDRIRLACGPTLPRVNVCLFGSLCGGTGGGLALDLAHLVRQIAPFPVHILGLWLLPEAFRPLAGERITDLQARAYAALRELERLSGSAPHQGYPLPYVEAASAGAAWLHACLEQAPYDQLYFYAAPLRDASLPHLTRMILLYADPQAASVLVAQPASLVAQPAAQMDRSPTCGTIAAHTLQLPLEQLVAGWAYRLGREVLQALLGVQDEDPGTRTSRADGAGGAPDSSCASGAPGPVAGQRWAVDRQLAGPALGALVLDLLQGGAQDARRAEWEARPLAIWEHLTMPAEGSTPAEHKIRERFLYPARKVLARRWLRPVAVALAEVELPRRAHAEAPREAQALQRGVEAFLDTHLGALDPATGARGGSDDLPSGEYPQLVQRWAGQQAEGYRLALRTWLEATLNDPQFAQARAGPSGCPVSFASCSSFVSCLSQLQDLHNLWSQATALLSELEQGKLQAVLLARRNVQQPQEAMLRSRARQRDYRLAQQQVLEAERLIAIVRAARRLSGQADDYTLRTLQALHRWRQSLAEELHHNLGQGAESVGQVRRPGDTTCTLLDLPDQEQQRYAFYAAGQVEAFINDLRWQVSASEEYDRERGRQLPAPRIALTLCGQELSPTDGERTPGAWLARCQEPWRAALAQERVLPWLMAWYDGSTPVRSLPALAQELAPKLQPPWPGVELSSASQPYYLYTHAATAAERAFLDALADAVAQSTAQGQVTVLDSSDPQRLTLFAVQGPVPLARLTAYREGWEACQQLAARNASESGPPQPSRYILAAERNAAPYEERLGAPLPARVVALLEQPELLGLLMQAWAYGEATAQVWPAEAGEDECARLLHRLRIEAGAHAGQWVYALTVADERAAGPARWWLTEPQPVQEDLSLLAAAEGFVLLGEDRWQGDKPCKIEYDQVRGEVLRQQRRLVQRADLGAQNAELASALAQIGDAPQAQVAQVRLAVHEHLRRLSIWLEGHLQRGVDEPLARLLLLVMQEQWSALLAG